MTKVSDAIKLDGEIHGCPYCGKPLSYFSGNEGIPAYQYCDECLNSAYDIDGRYMALLV